MGRSSHLVQFFWVASPIVQLAIAAVMVRRRLHREFPMFFAYSLFRSTTALFMFFLTMAGFITSNLFGVTSWFHETGCIILRFLVIYELFAVMLKPYSLLKDRVGSIFRCATVVMLTAAVLITVDYQWVSYPSFFNALLNFIDRTVDIIQCGLLLGLLLFSRYLRLSWRNYAFGIAVGLGVFAAADLGTAAILMERLPIQRTQVAVLMSLISTAMYLVCTLIWLAYALLPEPVRPVAVAIPEHDLESWDHELQRLLQR